MTERAFDGTKIQHMRSDKRCAACGRKTYTWGDGLCDGCSYRSDPIMRAWVDRQLAANGNVAAR